MSKQYESPKIEIVEFDTENILTASFNDYLPGDNNVDYEDFWK